MCRSTATPWRPGRKWFMWRLAPVTLKGIPIQMSRCARLKSFMPLAVLSMHESGTSMPWQCHPKAVAHCCASLWGWSYLAQMSISEHSCIRSDMSLPEKSTKSLSACRCLLLGEPLSGVVQTVGQLWRMSLQTLDAHGNVRAHGGEDITVEVEVSHP